MKNAYRNSAEFKVGDLPLLHNRYIKNAHEGIRVLSTYRGCKGI
jgi:hypothetical protein